MYSFLVRVELHGALYAFDYNTLHAEMKKLGFVRALVGDGGKVCEFPTAEYSITGNYDVAGVYSAAKKAANTTGKTSTVLSVRYDQWKGDAKA